MTQPLRKPIVCLITSGQADPANFSREKENILSLVTAATDAGISLVQIREKQIPARLLFELAKAAASITAGTDTRLLINDRADIALAAGADGVHLPANSLSAEVVRTAFPPDFLIGVSAHTEEEVAEAKNKGANYVLYGPVFATAGKPAPIGLAELGRVAHLVHPFPVVAVGGVDETNLEQVLKSEASGFAAIRFLNDHHNLQMLGTLLAESK